jgi:hypothetical protein
MAGMKKIIALTVFFLSAAAAVHAARPVNPITVTGLNIERQGDSVRLGYTADIAKKAARRGRSMVFAPVIANGGFRLQLPAVVVNGRGSKIARARREYLLGAASGYDYAATTGNGESIAITENVPFDARMTGGRITLESVYGGCCSHRHDSILLADNILPLPPQPVPAPPRISVGDSLAAVFTFVCHADDIGDEREGAASIFFRLRRWNIDPGYMNNEHTLFDIVGAVRAIRASSDSRVVRIVVGGYASPEGGSALNSRLGHERAIAVQELLAINTGLPRNMIEAHNGEVDWRGLRMRIEASNMPEKRELLRIIDNVPVWDSRRNVGRLGTIMRLNGGLTYHRLNAEHFPYLRCGAFIRVYYENQPNQLNN